MSRWHTTDFDFLPERAFTPRGGKGKLSGSMTLEGGKGGDAPAPDPRIGQAALRQIALAEQQWREYSKEGGDRDWLRGITEESLDISRGTAERANALSDYQLEMMKFNDERYRNVAVPFEDRLLEDVERFDGAEYKQGLVDKAMNDVNIAANNVQGQQIRGLTRMGVNPNSGNFAALRTATDNNNTLAMASAANKTRQAADQIGLASKMQMYGGMKGLAGLGNANAQLGMGAMGMGLNAGNSMPGAAASNIGANNSSFGSAMSGMSAGIQGGISYTNSQQNAAQINNANDPFATLLGAGTQLGAAYLGRSDRRLKQDIVLVGVDEATGLNLYEFSYIDGSGKRFRGVMADEVLQVMPEAVYTMPDGHMAVNYAMLGLEMTLAEGETV